MSKTADLNPSLGLPSESGPCFVVQRIEEEVSSPRLRDVLEDRVEKGKGLTNPDAAAVYKPFTERGPGGLISKMELTSHAQYRMDLRGISVADLRFGFKAFQKQLNDWKSQQAAEYQHVTTSIARGDAVEYLYKKWNLFIVFTMPARGVVRVITVYWKGMKDPRAPGTCVVPHIHKHSGYRAPLDELMTQTYRKTPGSQPDNQERQQVLPAPSGKGKTKDLGPQTFNGPGWSGTGPGGRTVHKDMARTQGKPGGDHPAPPARTSPKRRPDVIGGAFGDIGEEFNDIVADWYDRLDSTPSDRPLNEASMRGKPYPGADRHREQKGKAKRYYQLRYKRKRMEYKRRMKKWYRRYKKNPRYVKDQKRRDDNPKRFQTKPGGGYRENKERSKDRREDNKGKKKACTVIPVFNFELGKWATYLGIMQVPGSETPGVCVWQDGERDVVDVGFFFDTYAVPEGSLDKLLAVFDRYFDLDSMDDVTEEMQRLAFNFKLKYRPVKRQKKQKGQKKWKAKMQARKNRAKSKRRSKVRYKRLKRLPAFKKQQRIRRKHPERFKRRMAEVLTAPEIAFVIGGSMDLGYVRNVSPMTGLVTFYRATERGSTMLWDTLESLPNEDFMASVAFLSEWDEDAMFKLLDVELGLEAWTGEMSEDGLLGSAALMGIDCESGSFRDLCEKLTGKTQIPDMDPAEVALVDSVIIHQMVYDDAPMDVGDFPDREIAEEPDPADPYLIDPEDDDWVHGKVYLPEEYMPTKLAHLWVAKQAEMLYQKHPPRMDPDTVYDRAQDRKKRKDEGKPLQRNDQPVVEENPGSTKVIPWNTPDNWMNNKAAFATRTAARIREIVERCGEDLMGRSRGIRPKLMRVDKRNAMWLFNVPGSQAPYRVRVQATRRGNVRDMQKLDVKVSCSCPFWQWQGPEHHAKVGDYLYGRPAGTASKPTIKDPEGRHAACKHVLACFNWILSNNWQVPRGPRKRASSARVARRFLQAHLQESGYSVDIQVRSLVARYLELKGGS